MLVLRVRGRIRFGSAFACPRLRYCGARSRCPISLPVPVLPDPVRKLGHFPNISCVDRFQDARHVQCCCDIVARYRCLSPFLSVSPFLSDPDPVACPPSIEHFASDPACQAIPLACPPAGFDLVACPHRPLATCRASATGMWHLRPIYPSILRFDLI